jgi:hypothetical protein
MIYSDLGELKSLLEIKPGDTSEDKKLLFLSEMASQWIEELLGRPGIFLAQRTEYYKGTGTQRLLLNSRPILSPTGTNPGMTVIIDQSGQGNFPNAGIATLPVPPFTTLQTPPAPPGPPSPVLPLTYGSDFLLDIDQPDGITSRSGILIRLNDFWPKQQVRVSGLLTPFLVNNIRVVQVTYTGGFTVDSLPASFRFACTQLIARMREVCGIGVELQSENWIDRSVSIVTSEKTRLLAMVWPILRQFRNWRW